MCFVILEFVVKGAVQTVSQDLNRRAQIRKPSALRELMPLIAAACFIEQNVGESSLIPAKSRFGKFLNALANEQFQSYDVSL